MDVPFLAIDLMLPEPSFERLRDASIAVGPSVKKKALQAFVWVEIEPSTVEVDRRLEVLGIAEAAGGLLDPLDDGVDALETRIGQTMAQVGEQVRQMPLNQLSDGRHGLEPAVGRRQYHRVKNVLAPPGYRYAQKVRNAP